MDEILHGMSPSARKDSPAAQILARTGVAQWVIDILPLRELLASLKLASPEAIVAHLRDNSGFHAQVRSAIRVALANPAALTLFGVSNLEQLQEEVVKSSSDADLLDLCFRVLAIADSAENHAFPSERKEKNGSTSCLWILCQIPSRQAINDGILVSAIEITSLRQAEHDTEDRERFLATILKTVPDILMVFDATRKEPIYQNLKITDALGYSEQDVLDTRNQFLQYITHPDDSVDEDTIREMYQTFLAGKVYETTLRLQHSNGEWRHFYFRSAALDSDDKGRIHNIVVVARDITDVLKTQQILSEQQRRFQLLADSFQDLIVTTDTLFRITYASPSAATLLGLEPQALLRRSDAMTLLGLEQHRESLAQILADTVLKVDVRNADYTGIIETLVTRADGSSLPVEVKISILRDEHQLLEGMLILLHDMTERRKAEAAQRLASKVFENSMECIYITDSSGQIVQVNKAFIDITGYQPADVIGKHPSMIGSGWRNTSFERDIKPVLQREGRWSGELMSRRASGEAFLVWMSISHVTDEQGRLQGMITSFRDITEAKSSAENIQKLAYFDPLTGLPNRTLFLDRLRQALQRSNRSRRYLAILFMDLDGFKTVNDNHGHAIGDQLLTEAGKRLKDCIRSDDTVARLGGDEFIIILNALPDRESAESAAAQISAKIIRTLNEPFPLEGIEAQIGVSIGISLYPDDSNNEDELIRIADSAMYHAKKSGKNCYQFFTADMHKRAEQRHEIELDLGRAIEANEFQLLYQPIIATDSGKPCAFEALLRWQHPVRGTISPGHFLRAIEELGIGGKVGEWVIHQACQQLRQWRGTPWQDCGISVNLFSRQFRERELVDSVATALTASGIAPRLLTIEITEALLAKDAGVSASLVASLRALGVRVALDDFASGSFSLPMLQRLALDEIKLDRHLVGPLESQAECQRTIRAISGVASAFRITMVAKGVETTAQRDLLVAAGCPKMQGFLFSKPLTAEEVVGYFGRGNPAS